MATPQDFHYDDLISKVRETGWRGPNEIADREKVLRERAEVAEAAVDRVRAMHPRGDEEGSFLEPGLWCPACGQERSENGRGGCATRRALAGES